MKQIIKDLIEIAETTEPTLTGELYYKEYRFYSLINHPKKEAYIHFCRYSQDSNCSLTYNEPCTIGEAELLSEAMHTYYDKVGELQIQKAKEELGL